MSANYKIFTLGIVSVVSLGAIAVQAIPLNTHVQGVVSHLVGIMDTTAQAAKNPKAPSVRMTTCEVEVDDDPSMIYLYQEQALTKNLNRPYRQRVLHIKPSEDEQTIMAESFKIANPQTLIGLCDQPKIERRISLDALEKSVCTVFLKPKDNGYLGETPPQGCPANVQGAVAITNTILLHETGMDTWDRGLDENGNQVWGAENAPYQYRWINQSR